MGFHSVSTLDMVSLGLKAIATTSQNSTPTISTTVQKMEMERKVVPDLDTVSP